MCEKEKEKVVIIKQDRTPSQSSWDLEKDVSNRNMGYLRSVTACFDEGNGVKPVFDRWCI